MTKKLIRRVIKKVIKKGIEKVIEKYNLFYSALYTYIKTVAKFKEEILDVPFKRPEYVFMALWEISVIYAVPSKGYLFGKAIVAFGSPWLLPTVKIIGFISFICLFYLEYRRLVFILTTKDYSEEMKVYMFIRRIIKVLFLLSAMLCIVDFDVYLEDREPVDGQVNFYRIINYKNFRGKF